MGGTGALARRRGLVTTLGVVAVALVLVLAAGLGRLLGSATAASTASPSAPTPTAGAPTASPTASPSPTPIPTATPIPTPTPIPLVPAPLTGRLVPEAAAQQRPIAVMVDDHADARPQAGFNAASVVWQAPAEGGIPRYMLIFQENIPTSVGPIRSTRQYYVEWASELTTMLVHHGGSPEAQATLARYGNGQWVFNADGMRWEPRYVWRVHTDGRFAPHNVFTDGEHLRKLAKKIGADDGPIEGPWSFGPPVALADRPTGGTIVVRYPYETITYRYDAASNRYVRYINKSKAPQVDFADGEQVAPTNVVILRMYFAAIIGDRKHRLEAGDVGKGEAWIATNGVTVKGTWRKDSKTGPTRLFGPDGNEIVLTVGQTFVQVIARSYDFEIKDGPLPGASALPSLAPGGSPAPTAAQ